MIGPIRLLFLGLLSLLGYGGLSLLSRSFVYGQGHAERPLLLFLTLYAFLFLLYAASVRLAASLPSKRSALLAILGFALVFRVLLLFSQPIQEDDFYRYLWDGRVVALGLNPYRFSPQEVWEALQRGEEEPEELRPFTQIAKTDPALHTILSRVNHPWVPTIYPPLAQAVFALVAFVAPGSLLALRLLLIALDLGVILLLLGLLYCLKRGPLLVLVYAWSPLVLKEAVNSAHYDPLPVFFSCLAFLFILRGREILGYLSLALAILGKFYPLLFLPLFLYRSFLQKGAVEAGKGFLCTLALLVLGYTPFWEAGSRVGEGLLTYAEKWQANSLLFPLLVGGLGSRLGAGVVVAGGMCLVLLWSLRRYDVRQAEGLLWAGFLGVGSLFLLSPTGNPWYFTWVLPFLCFFPLCSWILLSGLLGLYYLFFYFLYHGTPELFRWFLWLEYLPFYVLLLWEIRWGRLRK